MADLIIRGISLILSFAVLFAALAALVLGGAVAFIVLLAWIWERLFRRSDDEDWEFWTRH